MKVCAIIAEYNPFHNGHLRQIEYVKNVLNAEKIVVVSSGNFTERGEGAILSKFTRAKHAVLSGVDAVIELPTVLSVANAETFALGAVSLISSLGIVDGLCFGVESGEKEDYLSLAKAMNNESKEFKRILKENLDKGYSLCKSKFEAVKSLGGVYDESLISTPNNILGLEYVKALLKLKSDIGIYPLLRNSDHNDGKLNKGITSAKSIRLALDEKKIKPIRKTVPEYVYNDLKSAHFSQKDFEKLILGALITVDKKRLAEVPDCTEGLENRIKALLKDNKSIDALIKKVTTRRYTESRIRRILTCNMLNITRPLVLTALSRPQYAKVLAVKRESLDILTAIAEKGSVPLLTRKSDLSLLGKSASEVFSIDVLASELYNLATDEKTNENQMLVI